MRELSKNELVILIKHEIKLLALSNEDFGLDVGYCKARCDDIQAYIAEIKDKIK